MTDFWESLVALKVSTLVAGGLAIGSTLLGIGGTIAAYQARDQQIQVEIMQTRETAKEISQKIELNRLEITSRVDELQRSVIRTEEQTKLTNMLLKQLLERK
jgi:hypothetical protein